LPSRRTCSITHELLNEIFVPEYRGGLHTDASAGLSVGGALG
jgi:hypothetical protein